MHVLLTGGTGYIGSAVLRTLIQGGHEVTALVRSDSAAARVAAAGASPVIGDITDVEWLAGQLAGVDGSIHTATPGNEDSVKVDAAVVAAVTSAFTGTGKRHVHTGGVWVYGTGDDITEDTPFDPPALTAWRLDVERGLLEAEGVDAAVVAPGIVYGHGAGIPGLLVSAPRTADGALTAIGSGDQHWTTVHVDDLADLYVRVLTGPGAGSYYLGVSGHSPTVREMLAAVSRGAGLGGAVEPETVEATRARLGGPFADALLLDQQATGARARAELGWAPTRPSILVELESGSYAQGS